MNAAEVSAKTWKRLLVVKLNGDRNNFLNTFGFSENPKLATNIESVVIDSWFEEDPENRDGTFFVLIDSRDEKKLWQICRQTETRILNVEVLKKPLFLSGDCAVCRHPFGWFVM